VSSPTSPSGETKKNKSSGSNLEPKSEKVQEKKRGKRQITGKRSIRTLLTGKERKSFSTGEDGGGNDRPKRKREKISPTKEISSRRAEKKKRRRTGKRGINTAENKKGGP